MTAITDLAAASSVADADQLAINQSGTDRRITRTMLGLTGTGGAAMKAAANVFTTVQTITPATDVEGLVVNMGATPGYQAVKINVNGVQRQQAYASNNTNRYILYAMDGGAGAGCYYVAERNNNASTPAAGFVQMQTRSGTNYYIWVDDVGNVRVGTVAPAHGSDTSGTVIGAQTSSLDKKDIVGGPMPIDDVLDAIAVGAQAVRRFTFKNGAFGGDEFSGVVIDYAPRYGMDRDADHPAGKTLNLISIVGDLLLAVANLTERVKVLEAQP